MLLLESANRVTFDVNVQGTATAPVVRCVIGDSPAVSFPAKALAEGKFEALIDLPKSMTEGSYPFKIEVLLNGRLFTPINTEVSVSAPVKETKEITPEVKTPEPTEVKPKASGKLSRLESTSKEPVQKLKPRKDAVQPVSKPKIRIADIANEAVDRKAPALPTPVKVIEQTASIPVSVVKGDIIYR